MNQSSDKAESVPQKTAASSCVLPQVVSINEKTNIGNYTFIELISDGKNDYLSCTNSMTQKMVTPEDPYVSTEAILENEKANIIDPGFHNVTQMISDKVTNYLEDTNSVPPEAILEKEQTDIIDPSIHSVIQMISDNVTNSLEYANSVLPEAILEKTDIIDPCIHSVIQMISDKVANSLEDANFVPPKKEILEKPYNAPSKVTIKHKKTDERVEYYCADSGPLKKIKLEELDYVSQNVTTLIDESIDIHNSDLSTVKEASSFGKTDNDDCNSVKRKTVKDPNYVPTQKKSDSNNAESKRQNVRDSATIKQTGTWESSDSMPKKNVINDPNYVPPQTVFENEKDDIVDPRWQSVKKLTSNEERYEQVRVCWGSSTVPDPDKNITYHSFRRKKLLKSGELKPKVKQHKRKATSTLTNKATKKPCTYLVDKEIYEVERLREERNLKIQSDMNREICETRERQYHEELRYGNNMAINHRTIGNRHYVNSLQYAVLSNLRHTHQKQIFDLEKKYRQISFECGSQFEPQLNALENIREEVLQFYKFYKGLGCNAEKDPTVLTDFQLKILADTENFYKQMIKIYK